MSEDQIGYYQDPKNGNGIVRSRTTQQIRALSIDNSQKQLDIINDDEWGKLDFPGIYVLFEKKKVYIGEAKNLFNRIKTHISTPDKKIKNWNSALIINDGRPSTQSTLNDNVVRQSLEYYLKDLFKLNKYNVVSQASPQKATSIQKTTIDNFIEEFNYFLVKATLIIKLFPEVGQEAVHPEDLKKILVKCGKKIGEWKAYNAEIDGEEVFIRLGSLKTKGWQITFRDLFKDSLQKGIGSLLVSRGKVLLIPLKEIQKVLIAKDAYDQNTIDIYIQFTEKGVFLSYKDQEIEITDRCLVK